MDSAVQDQGEFYDGETEGDDRKNEHNAKRAAEIESEESIEAKKMKLQVDSIKLSTYHRIIYFQ